MAIDEKYGRVTLEFGAIGEEEPVVVFRARDHLLLRVLAVYASFCQEAGSPAAHLRLIDDAARMVADWQVHNGTRIPGTSR